MKIVISGATGLVGSALERSLAARGTTVIRLTRRPRPGSTDIEWHPERGFIESRRLSGITAVVNLAGESVGSHRWSESRKSALVESRVMATRLLVSALGELADPPRTFLSVSATGYYGDRGEERLSDAAGPGSDFLAGLAVAWEMEAGLASTYAQVVTPRLGLVLSGSGGAMGTMLPLFRLGLGGRMGSGKQWWSWVSLRDVTRALIWLVDSDSAAGAWNLVGGNCTNAEFVGTLGRTLHRPTVLAVPRFALRLTVGEMADALLLASQRVESDRLIGAGFSFADRDLETTLKGLLMLQPMVAHLAIVALVVGRSMAVPRAPLRFDTTFGLLAGLSAAHMIVSPPFRVSNAQLWLLLELALLTTIAGFWAVRASDQRLAHSLSRLRLFGVWAQFATTVWLLPSGLL